MIHDQAAGSPAVIEGHSLEEQALSINAATNELRQTIAGVWDMAKTGAQPPSKSEMTVLKRVNPGQESVVEGDDRQLVAAEHFAPGGKYRGIIKLMIRYEKKPNAFAHGTGWLIRPDLMATAGHNVFDWKYSAGRAVEIKCYAGWSGIASAKDASVEFRMAKRCITTERWLSNRGYQAHDFALIQLDQPFTNVQPFKYIETPPFAANVNLGVVGYPAEVRDNETGERGAKMYEMFIDTSYNLEKQKDTMIEYTIDTEGGQSGSPVLLGNGLVAIGAHVYGGDVNTASVLGRYGNPLQDYIAAVDIQLAQPGLNLVPVSNDQISSKDAATGQQPENLTKLDGGKNVPTTTSAIVAAESKTPESFFSSIGDVLKVTEGFVGVLGPVVGGPFGGIVSAVAVSGLHAARTSIFNQESSFETALEQSRVLPMPNVERANLAAVNLLRVEKECATTASRPESIFDDIGNAVGKAIGGLDEALSGPFKFIPSGSFHEVIKTIGIPFQMADKIVDEVAGVVTQGLVLATKVPGVAYQIKSESAVEVDSPASGNQAAFITELNKTVAAKPNGPQEEGWWDDVGSALSGAVKDVGNVVGDAANFVSDKVGDVGNMVGGAANDLANQASGAGAPGQWAGQLIRFYGNNFKNITDLASNVTGTIGNAAKSEGVFEDIAAGVAQVGLKFQSDVLTISRAFVLKALIADQYLTATMARPVSELKAEGIFDDIGSFFSDVGKTAAKTAENVAKPWINLANGNFSPENLVSLHPFLNPDVNPGSPVGMLFGRR